jgi:hypothetical protein
MWKKSRWPHVGHFTVNSSRSFSTVTTEMGVAHVRHMTPLKVRWLGAFAIAMNMWAYHAIFTRQLRAPEDVWRTGVADCNLSINGGTA